MTNKTYIITGSTSGIGKELLQEFSKNNLVFASYRNEKYVDELHNLGSNVIPFYMDMTDFESITKAVEFIKSKAEDVDTLINAAGCVVAGGIEYLDINEIKKQFDVNTFSHLFFVQNLLKNNLLKKSKILNISSMASFGIFPFIAPYCASKRALDILFNSLQIEYGTDLKIVSLKLGVISTPLWEKSIEGNIKNLQNKEKYEKVYKYLINNARKNSKHGMDVKKAVQKIIQIEKIKQPKASYTIGYDAKLAEIFSFLPINIINEILKIGIKLKIKSIP